MGGRGASSGTAKARMAATKRVQAEHAAWSSAQDIAREVGTSISQAREWYGAVDDFTGSGYSDIRRDQREGKPNAQADALEAFIDRAPQWAGGPTYRGMDVHDVEKFKDMTTVGAVIDINAGTASWSTDIAVSDDFAHNSAGHSVVFVHDAPTQRGTSIKGLSNFRKESEVLVTKDARYRVVSVSEGHGQHNHRTYVHVTDA